MKSKKKKKEKKHKELEDSEVKEYSVVLTKEEKYAIESILKKAKFPKEEDDEYKIV